MWVFFKFAINFLIYKLFCIINFPYVVVVFPQDLLEKGFGASNFAMLGLGDIVIPGIFIALLLRFDFSKSPKQRIYFYSSFLAYFLGLLTTIFVMHVFKHAQVTSLALMFERII